MKRSPDITIHKLEENQLDRFVEVIRLFENVFEMEKFSIPESDHLATLLSKKDFFVFTALLGQNIVGALTVHVLPQYYSEKPQAYIYDLAVDTTYQRQGIGRKLIAAVNEHCKEKGFEEVFVQADKADDYALDFYRSTSPTREDPVVHFSYTLNKKG